MFERITTVLDARTVLDGSPVDRPALSSSHLDWIANLLSQSPASLQDIPLGTSPDGDLRMEWQAALQGAGVSYIRTGGTVIAACLILDGRFRVSEHAAIDAVQQTLQTGRTRGTGFDVVRKHRGRPLRAIILLEDSLHTETLSLVEYWSDCLATAYFDLLRASASSTDHPLPDAAGSPAQALQP